MSDVYGGGFIIDGNQITGTSLTSQGPSLSATRRAAPDAARTAWRKQTDLGERTRQLFWPSSPFADFIQRPRATPPQGFLSLFCGSRPNWISHPTCLSGPLELCLTTSVRGFYRSCKASSLQAVRKGNAH